jgi:hypothetical protein
MLAGPIQTQHRVVVGTGFLDVGKVRQQQAEVHGISPSIGLDVSFTEASRPEAMRMAQVAATVYSLPLDKGKVRRGNG